MEKHWGNDTQYVNDLNEKDTLKKLIEDLEWMLDDNNEFNYVEGSGDLKEKYKKYNDEYKRRSTRFFGRLDRHHRKFWD